MDMKKGKRKKTYCFEKKKNGQLEDFVWVKKRKKINSLIKLASVFVAGGVNLFRRQQRWLSISIPKVQKL